MTFPEQVKSHLWADIREMSASTALFAKNPNSDFSRNRKLAFADLLRFLISMQSATIKHELLKFFDFNLNVISSSGFIQQRNKLLPDALRHLLLSFNAHFPFQLFKDKYQLIACDGSEFNIARNPDDPDSFFPPTGRIAVNGYNMIHVTSLFDLLNKRYLDCVIQPSRKKNEFRAICDLADRFPYQGHPVFIADRGFSSYNFYAHASENNLFFLVRAKDKNVMRYLNVKALPNYLDTDIELILTRKQAKSTRSRPDLADQYRFVSRNVSFDFIQPDSSAEYPLHLRVVRVEISEGVYENLITNLPALDVSSDDLKLWYHMRWGIETSFRDLKHTIGTVNFHAKKLDFIVQEIWARLILFNFCAIISLHVIIKHKNTKFAYQVNFALAIKICHHFIRLKDRDPPPDIIGLIGNNTLPIRPFRSYARRHRLMKTASFCHRFS
jgi:Transposase DDE domain.